MNIIFKFLKLDKYPELLSYLTTLGLLNTITYTCFFILMQKLQGLYFTLLTIMVFSVLSDMSIAVLNSKLCKKYSVTKLFQFTIYTSVVDAISCILIIQESTRLIGLYMFTIVGLYHHPLMTALKSKFSKIAAYYEATKDDFDITEYQSHRETLMSWVDAGIGIISIIILLPTLWSDTNGAIKEISSSDYPIIYLSLVLLILYIGFRNYVVIKTRKELEEIIER